MSASVSPASTPTLLFAQWNHWLKKYPASKNFCSFLDDSGKSILSQKYTYRGLYDRVEALAVLLRSEHGLNAGDRVLLVFLPSTDFIVAFLACLRASIIAVPVYPPNPAKVKKDMYQFAAIQRSCGATVALTSKSYNFMKKLSSIKTFFSSSSSTWPKLEWIVTDENNYANLPTASAASTDALPFPSAEVVAFLQYTSGSTSDPKGVSIQHSNLAHNLAIIGQALVGDGPPPVVVSWLPQFHDMGLIGSWLGCLYTGGEGVYMSPISFLQRPPMWVEAISEYGGTHTQAPNFSLRLTVRKWKQAAAKKNKNKNKKDLKPLNLKTMRHFFNGAEPISAADIDLWNETFGPMGFPRNAMVPGYGLAEHTVYVCDGGRQRLRVSKSRLEIDRTIEVVTATAAENETAAAMETKEKKASETPSTVLVGCGFPGKGSNGVDLRIVETKSAAGGESTSSGNSNGNGNGNGNGGDADEEGGTFSLPKQLPEDRVGEIWIRSPSMAAGYWAAEEATESTFCARLAGAEEGNSTGGRHKGGFLRTGDLGFLHGGELFVCGRMKDLIIIRGRNYYPQDVEKCAELDSRLRPGCSAAFTVDGAKGGEELVLVAEVRETKTQHHLWTGLVEKLRAQLLHEHGLALSRVVLIPPRTTSKTSSGKIQRSRCKQRLLGLREPTFDPVFSWTAAADDPGGEQLTTPADGPRSATSASSTTISSSSSFPPKLPIPPTEADLDAGGLALATALRNASLDILPEQAEGAKPLVATDLGLSTPLQQLGFDSLMLEQLRGTVRDEHGAEIPVEIMYEESTSLALLVDLLQNPGKIDERLELIVENMSGEGGGANGGGGSGATASGDSAGRRSIADVPKMGKPKPCCVVC